VAGEARPRSGRGAQGGANAPLPWPLVPDHGKPTGGEPALAPGSRWVVLGVAAAVLVGVMARFALRSPLWLDEALSVNIAGLGLGEVGDALRRDGHPPLYYWLLNGWMRLVGDGDLAVRSLSAVIGVASLPLAWLAGRRLAGPSGARWALVVTALSPFAVRYSTEARMYALVMALVLAGYLLVVAALERPSLGRLAGVSLVAAGLLWSHYWSAFLLAVVGAGLVVAWWRSEGPGRDAAGRLCLALVGGGVLFLPWVPSLLDQLSSTGTPWSSPSRPTTVVAVTLDDLGGGGWSEARLHGAVTLLLVVVALLGRRLGTREVVLSARPQPAVRWELAVAAAALGLGAAVAFAGRSAYASRYAAIVVPLVLLAVAVGITVLPGALRAVAAVAWVGTALVGIGQNALVDRTESGEVAEIIAAGAETGDVVAVCPDQLGVSLQRVLDQLDAGIEVRPYPADGDPRFIDWRDYEERNEAADAGAFARRLHDDAGDGAIWLYWNAAYRTFEGQCDGMVAALVTLRTPEEMWDRPIRFEGGELTRFVPDG
jgi:mannosyltransferase